MAPLGFPPSPSSFFLRISSRERGVKERFERRTLFLLVLTGLRQHGRLLLASRRAGEGRGSALGEARERNVVCKTG